MTETIILALFAQEQKVEEAISRFRKRDKALFYGRKMLRKVKNIGGQVRNSGQGRKRKMVMKFARKILQLKKDVDTEQLKVFPLHVCHCIICICIDRFWNLRLNISKRKC